MTEELLFSFKNGQAWADVTLVTYKHGGMDLVIPKGPGHDRAFTDAVVLLNMRNMKVYPDGALTGPDSNPDAPDLVYYTVKERT